MPIYSHKLAAGGASAAGTTAVYTVPSSEGPTIVRGCTLRASAGQRAQVFLNDGGATPAMCQLDNTSGGSVAVTFFALWLVLEPGDQVDVYQSTNDLLTWFLSGQHFLEP